MVRLWQAPSGESIGQPLRHKGIVSSVAFDSDGRVLLAGSYDGTAQLWDIQSRQHVGKTIRVRKAPTYAARISPDGDLILTGSLGGTAQLWDGQTGEPVGELLGHTNEVFAVAFSSDGRTALTGSHDNTARLWECKTRKQLGESFLHGGIVMSVAYSPNGNTVMTGMRIEQCGCGTLATAAEEFCDTPARFMLRSSAQRAAPS